MLCITDTNIWIDLQHGDLIEYVFLLNGVCWAIPDIVLEELQSVDLSPFTDQKLSVLNLTSKQIARVGDLAQQHRKTTEVDLASLVLAIEKRAVLVTGDGALRKLAEDYHVEVHGVLWLLDMLVENNILSGKKAANGLEQMIRKGARLPHKEVRERLGRWHSGL